MAKLSISLDDALADELKRETGNVSAFVAEAVKAQLDRQRLLQALDLLDDELGPVDPALLEGAEALFDAVEVANEAKGRRPRVAAGRRR
jgi:hypothetical protein